MNTKKSFRHLICRGCCTSPYKKTRVIQPKGFTTLVFCFLTAVLPVDIPMGLGTAVVCVDDAAKGNGTAAVMAGTSLYTSLNGERFFQNVVSYNVYTIFYNGLQWENQRTAFHSFRKSDTHRPMVFAISWWASVVLAYNSLMVAVMGCMRIRLTGLYTASTTAASTTTTITARQPHGICHAAPK